MSKNVWNYMLPLVGVLSLTSLADLGQAQTPQQGSIWFQFADPKANEVATRAVNELSDGIVQLILALNGGRRTGVAVDLENSKRALASFSQAVEDFGKVSDYVGSRKIDIGAIEKNGSLPIYYDLVETLKYAGYSPPTNGKELLQLLENICDKTKKDLLLLMKYSDNKKSAPFKDAEQAAFDLILQKILLEKLGAAMNILTIAMQ